jgi:hypothetical protein
VSALACFTVFGAALLASGCETTGKQRELPLTKVAHAAPNQPQPKAAVSSHADRVRLGKHLVSTSACHDCHTPWVVGPNGPAPDMSRALSGHPEGMDLPPAPPASGPWIVSAAATNTAWAGPWGTSFTANLTPDKETGLGAWSEQNFVRAIRTGRHMGQGRPILPPMPVPVYQNFSDDELKAIFAYLKTIPAIKNRVPAPRPPASSGAPS